MKRNLMILGISALTVAGFAFSFKSKANSLGDLRAKAVAYCTPAANSDCMSSATGNIYAGYKPGTTGFK